MRTMAYTEFRAEDAETLDRVVGDREEVIVALDAYESLQETVHLLRSPENARRILSAIADLENGRGVVRDPLDGSAEHPPARATAEGGTSKKEVPPSVRTG